MSARERYRVILYSVSHNNRLTAFPEASPFLHSGQILSPWRGDIDDSGIGLSYRSVRLDRLAGRCDNPMQESTISPSQGLRIWLQLGEKVCEQMHLVSCVYRTFYNLHIVLYHPKKLFPFSLLFSLDERNVWTN